MEDSCALVLKEMALPSDRIIEIVSSARPPNDSIMNGTNSTPIALQAERCEANFR